MLDFLAGVPGRLKTLTDRLSATWAAKLDTLHDSRLTSARAGYLDKLNVSGSVANGADWTATRAGYLDLLNAGGVVGSVKSIQTGYSTTAPSTGSGEDTRYVDITISTVAAAKCVVIIQSAGMHRLSDVDGGYVSVPTAFTGRVTSSTNLRVSRATINDTSFSFRYYVIEVH